jgi:hypothetical protein
MWELWVKRKWKHGKGNAQEGETIEVPKHFPFFTIFPRINPACFLKSSTCIKCYSKGQLVTLKCFMWELGKKDNTWYEKIIEFNLSAKKNTCIFPVGIIEPSVFYTLPCLSCFTLPVPPIYILLHLLFFLCLFNFFCTPSFLFSIYLWSIGKNSAVY